MSFILSLVQRKKYCDVGWQSLDSLDNLHHVLVMQHVLLAHPLRLVLHGGPPHQGVLQVLQDAPMNLVTKILNRALFVLQHNRGLVIRKLTL